MAQSSTDAVVATACQVNKNFITEGTHLPLTSYFLHNKHSNKNDYPHTMIQTGNNEKHDNEHFMRTKYNGSYSLAMINDGKL